MQAPQHLTWVPDLLKEAVSRYGDEPFVTFQGTTRTYREFDERTDKVAAGLVAAGVKPGDVVSVWMPNRLEFLDAWWGILKAGGIFGPINPAFTKPEAAYVIENSRAVGIITDDAGAGKLGDDGPGIVINVDQGGIDELMAADGEVPGKTRGPDDLAHILYTSGTTGKPKGAMLSHGNVLANGAMTAELVPLGPGDRVGLILPLFHANAQIATTVLPMMIGCHVMMWEAFSASKFWATVEEFKPATISAVPTILAAVLNTPDAPEGPTSLRYIICGAAPLSKELMEAFESRFGIRILEGYGLTETTCVSSINPFYGERKVGSIGIPLRGQAMKIVDAEGNEVEGEGFGEIIIHGPNVMQGYLHNEKATAESIRDGWLHTGDVGYVDADGYFYIVDRSKDMIIRGGENIYPREIEEVLYEHPDILEVAVIGVPHEVRGEEVLAVVAPKPGATLDAEQLKEWAGERLARFKAPRAYEIRDELPKTPTGKISKPPLREEFGKWESLHTAST